MEDLFSHIFGHGGGMGGMGGMGSMFGKSSCLTTPLTKFCIRECRFRNFHENNLKNFCPLKGTKFSLNMVLSRDTLSKVADWDVIKTVFKFDVKSLRSFLFQLT